MWLHVDSTLVPECETMVIAFSERKVGQELGGVRCGLATNVVAVGRCLEESRRMGLEGVLKKLLGSFGL